MKVSISRILAVTTALLQEAYPGEVDPELKAIERLWSYLENRNMIDHEIDIPNKEL